MQLSDDTGSIELEVKRGKSVVILRSTCQDVKVEVDLTIEKAERLITALAEAVFHAKRQGPA